MPPDCIVIPGFVDSHRHTWETVIRGIAPDVSLGGYFDLVLDQLAPAYRPEDVYAGNYLGSLEAIDAGVTTLLDWSHISNTPEHADEAIRGLRDARLRAVYCYGNPNTWLADWWYTSTLEAPEDIRRVRERYFSSDDGLLTLAMGTRGPGLLHARGGAPRLGARAGGRSADQRPRRNGAVRRTVRDGLAALRAGAARRRHDVHPLQLPLGRRVPADRRERAARSRSRPASR